MENIYSNSFLDMSSDYLSELVENGEVCPLKVYILLTEIQKKTEQLLAKIKPSALSEAHKYNDELYMGYYVKVQESGVRYNYNENTTYKTLLSKIEEVTKPLNAQKKELETLLKSGYMDSETGQFVKGVSKTSTEIIKLTAK